MIFCDTGVLAELPIIVHIYFSGRGGSKSVFWLGFVSIFVFCVGRATGVQDQADFNTAKIFI